MKAETVAFIPARSGSKGLPGKNKRLFHGKPLVQWSIDQAKKAGIFDKIVVSSDDQDILDIAKKAKVQAIERSPELSTDEAGLDAVLLDYFGCEKNQCKYVCLLQPTSPLRSAKDIKDSYKHIKKKKYFSVVGVYWNPIMGWVEHASKKGPACLYLIHKRPNRQTRDDFYLENGAIYWVKWGAMIVFKNRICNPMQTKLYVMPPERSLEVDTELDWFIAEQTFDYMNNGQKSEPKPVPTIS